MGRQDDLDNHANQLNPNNDAYWDSRGYDGRPDDDWDDEDWDFDEGHQAGPHGRPENHDAPSAKPRGRKLQALLLMGGVASAGAAAAMILPWAKRLRGRRGR